MPNYDYACDHCGHTLEAFQNITEEPLKECPSCHRESLKRGIGGGSATFQFKGKGFYITDYCTTKSAESSPAAASKGCGCKGTHSCD